MDLCNCDVGSFALNVTLRVTQSIPSGRVPDAVMDEHEGGGDEADDANLDPIHHHRYHTFHNRLTSCRADLACSKHRMFVSWHPPFTSEAAGANYFDI